MTFLPIVERELRTAARRPATYWLRFFAALTAIAATLLALKGMSSYGSVTMAAKETFGLLSMLLMVFCLFAGMFQTADCLSSEKREGTLGLLFLTDLQGYDVVLGKLAASSLHCVFGLMAVLPVLSIPLLAGGVTQGEFWRVIVVLLTGLFFSLGVGMFASAVTRETRQSLGLSVLLVVVISGLLPAIYELVWLLFKTKITVPFLWPSLGFAFAKSADLVYNYRTGAHEFWGSVLTIAGLGFIGLLLATFILPGTWQEKNESLTSTKGGSRWRQIRFGTEKQRKSIRELLAVNPFYWLTARDRLSRVGFWIIAGVASPFWVLFCYAVFKEKASSFTWMIPFQILTAMTCILSLIFKCIVASEASRRLSDDHRSGALELILVTPLTEQNIVAGQRRALRKLFLAPILVLEFLFAMLWIVYDLRNTMMNDRGAFSLSMFGNMVGLLADFYALGWLGMWTGLRARYHHRAVLLTLLRILVVPWVMYFVLGFSGFFQNNSEVPLITVWFGFGVVNDLVLAKIARERLKRNFRRVAAGVVVKSRERAPRLATNYSNP